MTDRQVYNSYSNLSEHRPGDSIEMISQFVMTFKRFE